MKTLNITSKLIAVIAFLAIVTVNPGRGEVASPPLVSLEVFDNNTGRTTIVMASGPPTSPSGSQD